MLFSVDDADVETRLAEGGLQFPFGRQLDLVASGDPATHLDGPIADGVLTRRGMQPEVAVGVDRTPLAIQLGNLRLTQPPQNEAALPGLRIGYRLGARQFPELTVHRCDRYHRQRTPPDR